MKADFDAIVIGSGLGGLTAGAIYAKRGKKVLVLERHDKFGGAATVYRRKNMPIEVGLHELDGFDDLDLKQELWKELGLDQQIQTVPVGSFYEVRRAGEDSGFVIPDGVKEAIQALTTRFPQHKRGIERYFQTLCAIRASLSQFSRTDKSLAWWLLNGPVFPLRFWPIIRFGWTTLGAFLDRLFGEDEQIKITIVSNYQYYTDDPYQLSLLHFAAAQAAYHMGGGHYIHNGSQALSDALVEQIRCAGGKVEKRRNVTQVLMKEGQAIGVRHEKLPNVAKNHKPEQDVQEHYASQIFANAAPHCIAEMLPEPYQERFMKPYQEKRLSPSLWCLFISFNEKPAHHGVASYNTFVISDAYSTLRGVPAETGILGDPEGERLPSFTFVDYSQIDSGLNQEGRYFGVMCGLDQIENWSALDDDRYKKSKQRWEVRLIAALDTQFPGIAESVVFKEMGTARTIQRYLNTPAGAVYGFAPDAPKYVTGIPRSSTPVEGIYIASAFGGFGGGFTGAMLSGSHAATEALRKL
ncbi:MAG: NAD(P)/FAD-dependent oxidoreductase [Sedimenticola sp.]